MKTSSLITTAIAVLGLSLSHAFAKTPPGWTDDYTKALAQAKAEKKAVLLDITGSDWCPWCIKLDKEVFDKPEFKAYAKENLVLVKVDFPQGTKLPKHTQKQNEELKSKFKADGFPTTVLVDAEGKQVWKNEGYMEGGPSAFIKALNKALKKGS